MTSSPPDRGTEQLVGVLAIGELDHGDRAVLAEIVGWVVVAHLCAVAVDRRHRGGLAYWPASAILPSAVQVIESSGSRVVLGQSTSGPGPRVRTTVSMTVMSLQSVVLPVLVTMYVHYDRVAERDAGPGRLVGVDPVGRASAT